MNKFIVRAVILAAAAASTLAAEHSLSATADEEERRIHRHRLPYLLGLGGLGGLNAMAILFAVKLKILIVAAIVGLSVYYFTRGHSYGETIIPYSAAPVYSSPSFVSEHVHSAPEYSSYPGSDPYSAYSPDASSSPYGYPGHNDRSSAYDVSGSSSSYSSRPSRKSSTKKSSASYAATYSRKKRQVPVGLDAASLLNNINWGEIAFQFLGVDTVGCRKRFVCEFDFRAARNPFTRMAYTLIGQQFFDKYRDLRADSPKPAKFADCARMYRECAAAEEYNDVDDAELATVKPMVVAAEEEADPLENDVVEYDKVDEDAKEKGRSLEAAHNVGRLILLRAEQ